MRFCGLSGKVSGAGVTQIDYAGTELDSCLGKAVNAIQMPPYDGSARKVTYPFKLQ